MMWNVRKNPRKVATLQQQSPKGGTQVEGVDPTPLQLIIAGGEEKVRDARAGARSYATGAAITVVLALLAGVAFFQNLDSSSDEQSKRFLWGIGFLALALTLLVMGVKRSFQYVKLASYLQIVRLLEVPIVAESEEDRRLRAVFSLDQRKGNRSVIQPEQVFAQLITSGIESRNRKYAQPDDPSAPPEQ